MATTLRWSVCCTVLAATLLTVSSQSLNDTTTTTQSTTSFVPPTQPSTVLGSNVTEPPTPQTTNPTSRRVNIPPLITEDPPKDFQFREYEAIQLPCRASGTPAPNYRWTFNNAPFDPSGNDGRIAIQPGVGTLIFATPLARDEAYYQCLAYNVAGVAMSVFVNLRQGVLEPFPVNNPRTQFPYLGQSLTLRCIPPRSFPKANVFWVVITPDQRFSPIDYSDRVTQDPIGNLQFVNVASEDYKNNATYACVAENRVMRSIQQGEYNKIVPQGVTRLLYPPSIMWQSPTQQVALRGDTLSIKCIFAGSPTPRVTWQRIGGILPDRARLESFGQQLTIDNVDYTDSGSYECQGINDEAMTPVRRSFTLGVESAPYWVVKPQSVDVAENDSATFTCIGEGIPDPSYFWAINGIPITKLPSDPRRVSGRNDLIFYNVTNKDAQVIQCNVTNKNGYNFTNAYLNVYTEPPFILTGPTVGQKAAEGQTINLTCEVYGSPKPVVVWKKGDETLTGGRYTVLPDGNLQIVDLSLVDAGSYTCTATNRLGYIEAVGTLIVRRKTLIVTPPMDLMIPEGMESKFTCTGTTDPDEVLNLQILWKKDNQTINYVLAQRIFQNSIDNSLTISAPIYLDTGKYTCVATNGIDESEASAQLIVQAVPDPPVSVQVRCNSVNKTAEIWWQPGKENYAPILNFIVQYNTTFQQDLWYDIATNISQNNRRIVVNMSPWGNYTFRVVARNKIGYSLPSFQSWNVCTTEPAVPDKNPENVIGEGDRPGNLVIFWTPMPKIEQNGPDFKYIISYRRADIADAIDTITVVQNPEAWHYVVPDTNLGTYKQYRITVKANNARGDSSANLTPVIGYSGEDVPLVKPENVQVNSQTITATTAELFWTNVDTSPDNIRGFFRGYRIQYAKSGDDWNNGLLREQDLILNESAIYPRPRMKRQAAQEYDNRTMTRVVLRNIPPNSLVTAQVRVLTKYYAGPASATIEFQTIEGVPGAPKALSVAVVGATHFMCEWLPPEELNGAITGYQFTYQSITNLNLGRLQYRPQTNDPTSSSERLTGLNPNTTYRIYLAAVTSAGSGAQIFIDATTSLSGAPDPPTFAVIDINETWANISWEPSRSGVPGSVFYVQYRPRERYEWLRSPDEYLLTYMPLVGLDPGTTYQVRVIAKNGDGYEAAATWLEFHTPGVAPGNFDISTSAWFYGIWISLFLIIVLLILLFVAKKYTDKDWEEKEALIEEQVRQLQAEEAARQMGVFNQYQDTGNMDESADFKHPEDFGPEPADNYDYDKAAVYAEPVTGARYQPASGAYGAKYSPVPEGYAGAYVTDVTKGGPTSDTFV